MVQNSFSLSNKKILVTGGTSGIGLEICKQISIAGGNFIAIGRKTQNIDTFIKSEGLYNSESIAFDLKNIEQINTFVSKIENKIDGFVHCAGIAYISPMQFLNLDDYDTTRKINLDSALVIMSELLKRKKINKNASIVFISSISAIRGAKANGLYAITKAALDGVAKVYANELSSKRIRVNTIQPGMVQTDMATLAEDLLSSDTMNLDRAKYPFGYGTPIDIALPTVFLLSDAAKWITGQSLVIDGGRTSIL